MLKDPVELREIGLPEAAPVSPLIDRLRPLHDGKMTPVHAHRNATPKYLILLPLLKKIGANLSAKSIISPVFRVLQGSASQRDRVAAPLVIGAALGHSGGDAAARGDRS